MQIEEKKKYQTRINFAESIEDLKTILHELVDEIWFNS